MRSEINETNGVEYHRNQVSQVMLKVKRVCKILGTIKSALDWFAKALQRFETVVRGNSLWVGQN